MKLFLFFTRGVSLEEWVEKGLFDREKLIYHKHIEKGYLSKVYWLTYGEHDRSLSKKLISQGLLNPSITVLSKPGFFKGKFGNLLFSLLSPIMYMLFIKKSDILKTNQMDGAWSALIASKLFNKKLYLRTGYTKSRFIKDSGSVSIKHLIFSFIEKHLYRLCDLAAVSSMHDREYLLEKDESLFNKLRVLENYIDTDCFFDMKKTRRDSLVFVGRLTRQKNLYSLIDAVKLVGVNLDIYGDGEEKESLVKYVEEKKAPVEFKGVISNRILPIVLNDYKYYILCSFYEGMPKTLLEAMACGCICIGTEVKGISELISGGKNGFIIPDTSVDSICKSIVRMTNSDQHHIVVQNAIKLILGKYSLNVVVDKEFSMFQELV